LQKYKNPFLVTNTKITELQKPLNIEKFIVQYDLFEQKLDRRGISQKKRLSL